MPLILKYWVLEFELEPIEDLSPGFVFRIGKNPTLIVLRFDNEHAEPRNEDVINLGCTVLHLKCHMIHQMIIGRTELPTQYAGNQLLADVLIPESTEDTELGLICENESNMDLIAAAPEMYKALKYAQKDLAEGDFESKSFGEYFLEELTYVIDTVLTKIEGKE